MISPPVPTRKTQKAVGIRDRCTRQAKPAWSLFSRGWNKDLGVRQFAKLIEFTDRRTADRFRDAVPAALDRHLEQLA